MRPATTYSPNAELGVSTIGPGRLNGRVRNGNGCIPAGNITDLTNLLNHWPLAEPAGVWLNDANGDAIIAISNRDELLYRIIAN